MLSVSFEPDLPSHVRLDGEGIAYSTALSWSDERAPKRFEGPARPGDPQGPPWSTLVFGLETGAHDLRARFLSALTTDAEAGRPLDRYGEVLESVYREAFGGRGATADAPDFLTFVQEALIHAEHAEVRAQLARGIRAFEERRLDERIARLGATGIVFSRETGHVPADHSEVLYWLSALVPGLRHTHFAQLGGDPPDAFELLAWCGGRPLRAPARNLDDWIDAWSCVGFVNALVRDLVGTDVRIHLTCEDEAALAVAGPPRVIAQLREAGVLGWEDDDDA